MSKSVIKLTLPFPPTANNLFPTNRATGQRFTSQEYKRWQEAAGWDLKQQRPGSLAGAVKITYEFGRPDKRRRDVANLEKACTDLLVKHKVIQDDCLISAMTLRWLDDCPPMAILTIETA